MEWGKKEVWMPLAGFAAGSVLTLVGGIIGRSTAGWILFILGILSIAAVVAWRFSMFKDLLVSRYLWALVGGGIAALLVLVGLILMLVSPASSGSSVTAHLSDTPMPVATTGSPATAAPTEAPTATNTPEPTMQASTTPVGPVFVCLNENTQVGYSLRVAPRKDAAFGGEVQWGSCFTVDGQAAGYPGWYHVTIGQGGSTIGFEIDVDETKTQLWVDGYYLESFGVDLKTLPEIQVTGK